MSAEELLKARMGELTTRGESLLQTKKTSSSGYGSWVATSKAVQWTTSVHQVVLLALGEKSVHFKRLEDLSGSGHDSDYSQAESVLTILQAALDDFADIDNPPPPR